MIKLFEKDEQSFSTLGIGVLTDCYKCEVTNELNGKYEISLEYPMSGIHFEDIIEDRIIVCKPDRYSDEQPFRIYSISRPLNGKVKIKAEHISYDMNYYPVGPIENSANSLNDALEKISESCVITQPFKFINPTNANTTDKAFTSTKYKSLRNIFYSSSNGNSNEEKSIIETFECDVVPDKFTLKVYPKGTLGSNNGVTFRYGKNLKDITQDTDASTKLTGVFPVYSKQTSNQAEISKTYQKAYLVEGKSVTLNNPLSISWMTYTDDVGAKGITFFENLSSNYSTAFQLVSTTNHPCPDEYNGHYFTYLIDQGIIDVTNSLDDYPPRVPVGNLNYSTSYTNVTLPAETDNGIIYLNGRQNDPYQKIAVLDLTNQFEGDVAPTQEELRQVAEKYIEDNHLGDSTISVRASFILLSSSSEFKQFTNAERINLGDIITVIYEALGVSDELRVQSITYDSVKDEYISIGIGDRRPLITDRVLRKNDKMSELRNDTHFVIEPQVADVVETGANNLAGFTEEQIMTLRVQKFYAPGLMEGSSPVIDQLVAKMLIADDAEIRNQLVAGSIVIKGSLEAVTGLFSGSLNVTGSDESYVANLRAGNIEIDEDQNGKATLHGIKADINTVRTDEVVFREDSSDPDHLKMISGSAAQTVTRTFSAGPIYYVDNQADRTIDIVAEVVADSAVPENTFVSVPYTLHTMGTSSSQTFTGNVRVLIPANASSGTSTVSVPNFSRIYTPLLVTAGTVSPASKSYRVYVSGTKMFEITKTFVPSFPSAYSLGANAKTWKDVWADNTTIQTSDRRLKTDISYDIDKFLNLFDKLKPVSFKLKNGESGRTHLGLISQDVKEAMDECGIDSKEFAAFVRNVKSEDITNPTEEDYMYFLRYGEFHALEIKKIQLLEARIKKLEDIIMKGEA